MRNVHLNTEYVVLFRNPRDKSQFGYLARQLEPKHSNTRGRLRGRHLATVLASLGGSDETSHSRCTALQKQFSTAGSTDGVRDWSYTDMSNAEARRHP